MQYLRPRLTARRVARKDAKHVEGDTNYKQNYKFETRSPKLETILNGQKVPRASSDECQGTRDFSPITRPSTSFLSDFDIRISNFIPWRLGQMLRRALWCGF
jgi:hypothetical protein